LLEAFTFKNIPTLYLRDTFHVKTNTCSN